MSLGSARHRAVLEELTEWWEDLCEGGIGSRVVLVPVPSGWGRSSVLREFRKIVEDPHGPVTLAVSIGDVPLASRAIQAQALQEALATAVQRSRAVELLGLGTAVGEVQLGLGLGGLFASGLAAAVPLLLASLAVTAAGNAWDGSPAGQQGAVARAARYLAAVSASVPVVVIIDDADHLDPDLAVTMIENLAGRYDGQVLVVAAVQPGSVLESGHFAGDRYELLGRIAKADANPDMSYTSRADLAREISPGLPAAATERIARRTQNFSDVFTVAAAGKLAELTRETGPAMLAGIDAVIDAALAREKVSAEAVVLAWAGGALYVQQADSVLQVLGADRQEADPWVARSGMLARLADPEAARLTVQVAALAARTRRQLAAIVLDEAVNVARNPDATLVERVIARQAAHHVRADLGDRGELTKVQVMLIRGLERLSDPAAAYDVARAALAELPAGGHDSKERAELLEAVLRVAPAQAGPHDDPLIDEAIALATADGALLGLEARVWAAVSMLNRSGPRDAALQLTDQVSTDLADLSGTDIAANQWRLLLAFHAGRAGYPDIRDRLLTPMINRGTARQQEAAQAILYATEEPRADTRLQIIILEAELAAMPPGAEDELLRLHSTLAGDHALLGEFRDALQHGTEELALRHRLQGPDHRQTLRARARVVFLTGNSGDSAEALRLLQELLPDRVRVLGNGHPDVLATRANIAAWTGKCGNNAEALRLDQELLPDRVRVLGNGHPDVLITRNNIAVWTGECGNNAGALRLFQELLPDLVRVLGSGHPDVLTTRANIAAWTGECGNNAEALRLFQELLPDQVRVQGSSHPDVLITRNNIERLISEDTTEHSDRQSR
jgi:Tetratricopeptide repeat